MRRCACAWESLSRPRSRGFTSSRQADPPVTAELMDAYLRHGVYVVEGKAHIFIDLKPRSPRGTVFHALDWLSATAAAADQDYTALSMEMEQAIKAADAWYTQNVLRA